MDPDPDNPFARVERTLVSVWCYITEAVSRFLRPQPVETANNDPNSLHESRVDSEPPDCGQTGIDICGEEASEELSLPTVSLLSSSSPVVAWERCTADIDVKPREDRESKKDMTEEHFGLAGNDHAGQLVTEDAKPAQGRQEKTEIKKRDTYEEGEMPENDSQHTTGGSGHMQLKERAIDEMDSSVKEEGYASTWRLDDHRKVEETSMPTQEDNGEENKEGLEEESKIKECIPIEEEESDTETKEQRNMKAVMLGDANICEDASQLSSANENSEERTQQVETQPLVCKELSGVAEDERVQVAVIEEEEPRGSATHEKPEQEKSSRAVKDARQEEDVLTQSVISSEEHHGTGEEQFGLTGSDLAEHLITEDMTEHQLGLEKTEIQKLHTCVGREGVENVEDQGNAGSENSENEAICEEMEKRGGEAGAGEEPVSIVSIDDFPKVDEAKEDLDEDSDEIQEDTGEENEEDSEEESKIKQFTISEVVDIIGKTGEQSEGEAAALMLDDANICEDASQLSPENKNSSNEETKDLETQLPVSKELLEDELTNENVQMKVVEEEDLNTPSNYQTTEEESEQDQSRTIEDVWQEENVSTESVTNNDKDVQKAEPDTTEFTFKEENVQTATEKEVSMEEMSADDDNEVAEKERLSSEVTDKESCMKIVCLTAPVTVKAEGESAQEINRDFNNIPLGLIEGQTALSHELSTEVYKVTPEAVPEYNNELESDENTLQRFLEEGNSEEIQTIHLPEEVEGFKSSGTGGGEYFLTGQGSAEENKNELDLVVEQQAGALQFVEDPEKPKSDNINLELEHFSEVEEIELLDTSMKTEIKQPDEEFETYSADETELQDGDETVEFKMTRLSEEAAEDGCERREVPAADEGVDFADESLKGEEERITEMSLGPELVETFSLQDDCGNLKHSEDIKPELFDESAAELLEMGVDTEEQGCTHEGELDHEILDLNEITPLQLVGTAADLITGQSELSQHLETNNQAPLRAPQMTEVEITADTETADESNMTTLEGLSVISVEETKHEPQPAERYSEDPAGEHQDVIDEEILDLWIETAMSKDTDRIREEDLSEPGLQKDQPNEESGKTSSEKKKDELMEANSDERASASEIATSLTTLEYLDQPFSETPLLKSADPGLLADINGILNAGSNSEDICEFSTPNSKSVLFEETVETVQSYLREDGASSEMRSCPDSGASSPESRQTGGTSQEEPDEAKPEEKAETDTLCEEADVTSLITEAHDELLKAAVSDFSDQIQRSESGQHKEDLEALSEEGSESPSGGEPQTECEKQQFSLIAPEQRSSEEAEITADTETADESNMTSLEGHSVISAEETKHEPQPAERYSEDPAGEHQDVIYEEILDLWIETAMSKDTDRIREEDLSEPGLQKDQPNEESGKTSSEKKKDELMEANSDERASASEIATSLTTLEYLDQPFSETPLLKSADPGLLADINGILNAGSNSEDICEFSTPNSKSALFEETVETVQSYLREDGASSEIRSCPDSGASSPESRQTGGTSQEEPDEAKPEEEAETDTLCEEADVTSLITEAHDELLKAAVSDFSDQIQRSESGQHKEDLEALSEEGSESPSGGEPQTECEKQQFSLIAPEQRSSEELTKSFPAPSKTELEEDQSEVDGPMFDFAMQRSRIAVKNPRARPPTDPRSLINKPSVDPTPPSHVPGRVPLGVPLGGLGMGIKLP
ncbi:hypothetical protein AMECASPLE_011216, partial [Ameca splendens]